MNIMQPILSSVYSQAAKLLKGKEGSRVKIDRTFWDLNRDLGYALGWNNAWVDYMTAVAKGIEEGWLIATLRKEGPSNWGVVLAITDMRTGEVENKWEWHWPPFAIILVENES